MKLLKSWSRVAHSICILRCPSNFVVFSMKVAQAVEVAFHLKENPMPLDFITEVNFKTSRLAPIKGFQVAFVANPTTIVPSLEATTGFEGRLSVV